MPRHPAASGEENVTDRSSRPTTGSPGDRTEPGASGSDPDPSPGVADRVGALVDAVDRRVRRHTFAAVLVAVLKKFGDDRGGQWAALVAYYGFFSLFPLLLVLTTVLGFVVQGDEGLQERILDSALAQFPILGDEIQRNLGALEGSSVALAIGLVGALWAGMGVVLTLQDAMNDLWDVPRRERPDFLRGRLRALLALLALGVAAMLSAALAALGAVSSIGALGILALAGTFALNTVVFGAAFRYLTVAQVGWRHVLPGAVTAAAAWMGLLALGSWLVARQLANASALYGFFAIVIGLLSWIYLGARVTLLSAELNVVLARRLWPRSLNPPPLTEPDRRVLAAQAEEEAARRRRRGRSAGASRDPSLRLGLVVDAEAGGGPGTQAVVVDRAATGLARPVRAFPEPVHRPVDVRQLRVHVLEDRQVALPFERLGPTVGVVLIHRRELALHRVIEPGLGFVHRERHPDLP